MKSDTTYRVSYSLSYSIKDKLDRYHQDFNNKKDAEDFLDYIKNSSVCDNGEIEKIYESKN